MIAFYGMGLLGSNFTRAWIERGETVHVWNRTASRARALESEGARAFDDAAEAARGADRVHLALSDDAAVDEVLERARDGLERGVVVVDHTTTSPTGAVERLKRWAERGVTYQHAPVFMGPQNAREGTGFMLVSGERARYEALEPALSKMTGTLVYLGPDPARAAQFKLLGNLFLISMTGGLVDFLSLAKAMGVQGSEAASLFDWLTMPASVPDRLKRLLTGEFGDPSWELVMARKDARLMMEAAERARIGLTTIPAVADAMDHWIAAGHGHEDWTVMAKEVV